MNLKKFYCEIAFIALLALMSPNTILGSIVVLNGLTHENTVNTGESYRGQIEIQNTATTEKSVKIYLKDYIFNYTGESRHDEPGTINRSNANWIIYNPNLAKIGPGEKTMIDFVVKVPENLSLTGTFWSVIMVEGISSQDTSATQGVTINTAIRYAVQVVTHIGKTGKSDIQFLGLELNRQNNINYLNVIIENTGERQLRPELALELFDENGISAGIVKAERKKTFPGTSIKTIIILEGIKPGNYTGILVADCDEDHVYGTNVSFKLE